MRFVYVRFQVTGQMAADVARKLPVVLADLQSARHAAGKYTWAIGDLGERTVDGERMMFGRLRKTARAAVGPDTDTTIGSSDCKPRQGKKTACSNFFIHPSNAIMALEDKPLLPAGKFLKKFKQFWEKSQTDEIEFEFLKNEPEIFAAINRWDKITAAKFELCSNPSRAREDYAPLDDLLNKAAACRASFKFESGSNGLAKDNSIIQQGVSMSAAGYGEFSLKGVEQGTKTSLNSRSFLIADEFFEAEDLASLAPVVWSGISKRLVPMKNSIPTAAAGRTD